MFLRVEQHRFDKTPFILSGPLGHVIYIECNNYKHGRTRAQTLVAEERTRNPKIYEDKYFTVHTPLVCNPQCDTNTGVVTTYHLDGTLTIDEVSVLTDEMISVLKERLPDESNRST